MMFASLTAKVLTAACVLISALALFRSFFVTVAGGSPYVESALALVFFAMFPVGSY